MPNVFVVQSPSPLSRYLQKTIFQLTASQTPITPHQLTSLRHEDTPGKFGKFLCFGLLALRPFPLCDFCDSVSLLYIFSSVFAIITLGRTDFVIHCTTLPPSSSSAAELQSCSTHHCTSSSTQSDPQSLIEWTVLLQITFFESFSLWIDHLKVISSAAAVCSAHATGSLCFSAACRQLNSNWPLIYNSQLPLLPLATGSSAPFSSSSSFPFPLLLPPCPPAA